MFQDTTSSWLTAWHGEPAPTTLVRIPACFTPDEWGKYYVAAYYSNTINRHRKSAYALTEEEVLSRACKEDCPLSYQLSMQRQGKCHPVAWTDTPLSRAAEQLTLSMT